MNHPVKSYSGKMTLEKAAMMRYLHKEGATVTSLAVAFGTSFSTAEKIVQLRQWGPLTCRGCWRLLTPQEKMSGSPQRQGYCAVCKDQFCCHCGQVKDPGRRSPRCPSCDREKWNRSCASTTHCRECGEEKPPERRDTLCSGCRREYQRFVVKFRNNVGKVCENEGCERLLPAAPSWSWKICRRCADRHMELRRGLQRRRCVVCKAELAPYRKKTRCRACAGVQRVQRNLQDILGRKVPWERAAKIYGTGPSGCQRMYRRLREGAALGESLAVLREMVEQ